MVCLRVEKRWLFIRIHPFSSPSELHIQTLPGLEKAESCALLLVAEDVGVKCHYNRLVVAN